MKRLSPLILSFLTTINVVAQGPIPPLPSCDQVFISEYVEGWGNNKAVEIYNPTDQPINLSGYALTRYSNGSTTQLSVPLSGIVQPYDVYVLVLDKRDSTGTGLEEPIYEDLEALADTFLTPIFDFPTSAMYFNGNDAVALTYSGFVQDVLGRIGEDPGNGWGWEDQNGVQWTKDHTLIRNFNTGNPDPNGTNPFFPEVEWDSLPANTFDNLGFHDCFCNYAIPCTSDVQVSFSGLNSSYVLNDDPALLTGTPYGGVFFGNGYESQFFYPQNAGVGTHSITYTYVDSSGCVGSYSLCTTVDLNVSNGPENEISNNDNIEISPNPSNGLFQLSLKEVDGVVSYSIFDALGKEIQFESFVANGRTQKDIDLNEFGTGIYTIQLNTGQGLFSEQLIKQ